MHMTCTKTEGCSPITSLYIQKAATIHVCVDEPNILRQFPPLPVARIIIPMHVFNPIEHYASAPNGLYFIMWESRHAWCK